uniref:NADH-ubiquinone oxidoreductase chain 6 n=1 Tax=Cyrtorhinus sp. TaxID=2931287 RepID=A0A8T9ZY86_9HEMI|nr:NADH dehydrogenase subunit 6 [Cyrtorhinus sp.]
MIMMLMTMNIMFFFMNHPLSMGLILIIQTLLISLMSGMMMKSFWMSYILTITMLSGMLVLFIYMSSIASNEKFKNKKILWMCFMLMMIMTSMFLFLEKKMIIKNNYLGMEMSSIKMSEILFLNKMFMAKNMMITILMVIYLFISMIVSTSLINISEGPMRLKI